MVGIGGCSVLGDPKGLVDVFTVVDVDVVALVTSWTILTEPNNLKNESDMKIASKILFIRERENKIEIYTKKIKIIHVVHDYSRDTK